MEVCDLEKLQKLDFSVRNCMCIQSKWDKIATNDYVEFGRRQNLLHLVTRGTRYYTIGDTQLTASAGDVIFIPDGTKYITWNESPCSGIGVCFDFSADLQMAKGVYVLPQRAEWEALPLFNNLLPLSPQQADTLHQRVLVLQILDGITAGTAQTSDSYRLLLPAMAFIGEHYWEKLPVSAYANACNLSESYFRKLFVRYTGLSPVAYRDSLRVKEARRLLAEGLQMSAVADRLGFYDSSHLRKCLKQFATEKQEKAPDII